MLRDLRAEAGLSQAQFAERLGRTQTWVAKYETGQRRIDFLDLRVLCQALGVDVVSVVRRFELVVTEIEGTPTPKAARPARNGGKRRPQP